MGVSMKLNRILSSSSDGVSSKKLIVKKLISTLITTAVMGAATLLFSSFHKSSPLQMTAMTDDETVEQVAPRGLSRKRSDFDKAINILADAAATDADLADYYSRVAKRVKGEAVKPEK